SKPRALHLVCARKPQSSPVGLHARTTRLLCTLRQEGKETQPYRPVRRHPRCTTASEGLPQGSDSTTRAGMPATATPATSSTAGSTPLGGVDPSTLSTTGVSHRSLRAPRCL